MSKSVLCIWLSHWPIQRLVVAQPELNGRALVLVARAPRQGERVVYVSSAAYRHGVRVGMPPAEVTALAEVTAPESCRAGVPPADAEQSGRDGRTTNVSGQGPEFVLRAHDPDADRVALETLAGWCEQFSPVVGLETADEPAGLLLDVTGMGPLFGGQQALCRQVTEAFEKRGYTIRLATGDTVGLAWALAHYGWKGGDPVPSEDTACDAPGAGLCVSLGSLSVEALRLPDETVQLLGQLGIRQVGQLLALPRASLVSRFGDRLVRRLAQLEGTVQETIVAHRPPPDFQASWSLEHPTGCRQTLQRIVEQLIEHVASLLAERGQGALELECRLRWQGAGLEGNEEPEAEGVRSAGSADPRQARIRVGLFQPTAAAPHLAELACLQLEQLSLPGPVAGVCVVASTTAPLPVRQEELFVGGTDPSRRHLAILVDRMASRLGREHVCRVRLQADAQPERAWRYVVAVAGGGGQRASSRPAMGRSPLFRPLRMEVLPLAMEVVAVVPDGPPVRFRCRNRQHQIMHHEGPERIETGWWRGRSVRRDYYRVVTTTGHRFWIFRELTDGGWFFHGEFV